MGHRWLSTDNGCQCYRCGLVLDYAHPASDCDEPGCAHSTVQDEQRAHEMASPCSGPATIRAHHFVLGLAPHSIRKPALDCAYGDATITYSTEWATIPAECIGG